MELPNTVEEIGKLIDAQVQENLHLDYKSSDALINKKARSEIAKDVSAFANSDGGMIIYGVVEHQHLPMRIDSGVDHQQFSRETLEQIVLSSIAPQIEDVRISQIPLSDSHSIFAVKVPKSFRGPHQERQESMRYYRRYNFQSRPMEDYEIREAYNRRREVPSLVNIDIEIDRGIAKFVVKNYGDSTARDISFNFPDGMTWLKGAKPKNVIEKGIAVLPPGKTMYFLYNVFPDLLKMVNDRARCFAIHVDYFHPELR